MIIFTAFTITYQCHPHYSLLFDSPTFYSITHLPIFLLSCFCEFVIFCELEGS